MADHRIYLDHNATTPVDPDVLEAMLPYFREEFGNASSRTHPFGWRAEEAVETARGQVARALGCTAREIVFTSGATESNNIAVLGAVLRDAGRGGARPPGKALPHVVTSSIEHHAVLDPCRWLEKIGAAEVTYLEPDRHGLVSAEDVRGALRETTRIVSIMAAHNEIGTIYPFAEIAGVCRERGVRYHCDAAQAFGKVPLDLACVDIDLLSLSGHKIYGPKGVGALVVRRRSPSIRLEPILHGGGHERGLRPGTLNVPAIVGLGAASTKAVAELEAESTRLRALSDRLLHGIRSGIDGVHLSGHPDARLPGNLNLSFEGVPGEALIVSLSDLAVSSGSACTSSQPEPSYVLRALGVSRELAHASIRFGIGRVNTQDEIDHAITRVVNTVRQLRQVASVAG